MASEPTSKSRLTRWLRTTSLFVGMPYLAITLLAFIFQRQLLYVPTVATDLSVSMYGFAPEEARDVVMRSRDGCTLKGWWIHSQHKTSRSAHDSSLVVYFPGNAGNRSHRVESLHEMTAAGFDVLIFDYRGYGDSEGSPSQTVLEADALEVWRFTQNDLGYEPSQIVLFGESLGGAVVLSLWSNGSRDVAQPAAVILDSTFAAMPDLVAWHFPWFPFQYLVRDRWPSRDRIGRVPCPVILFHGTWDEIVPFSQGQLLASAAANAQLIAIEGGMHNGTPVGRIRRALAEIHARIAGREEE